jgi:Papain family cysteine protease
MIWSLLQGKLSGSTQYPYTAVKGTCKSNRQYLDVGATLSSSSVGFNISEETLLNVVLDKGVAATVLLFNQRSLDAFRAYQGGIFNGCTPGGTILGGLAVTVVGFGTEGGQNYWLIKNSWGTLWGERGYLKLRRGVKACDIGREVAIVDCVRSPTKSNPSRVKGVQDCEEGDEACENGGEGEENEDEGGDEGENDEE